MTETEFADIDINEEGEILPLPTSTVPQYDVQQAPKTGRWQVLRVGPKGGKKLVTSYADTPLGCSAALTLSATLTVWAEEE